MNNHHKNHHHKGHIIRGTWGDDDLMGSARHDVIHALGGNDYIFGDAGNDVIKAGSGDDTIKGGEGNDLILGGSGTDTAVFEGSLTDYAVSSFGWCSKKVKVYGPDCEVDILIGVEAIYFEADDITIYIDGRNNGPVAEDDTAETAEDAVLVIAAADLLANDSDFDGDALTVTDVSATSASGAAVSLVNGEVTYDPGDIFAALYDGETATDTFTYTVDDGNGGTATATVTVTITGKGTPNTPPELSLAPAVTIDENTTAVATVAATDADGDTLTYAIAGGADAALFTIDSATGELSFITAPDFEAPADDSADNVYDVIVSVDDGNGGTDEASVAITVADVDETPANPPRINEIHYDNAGTDEGEFIEVRVTAGADASGLVVELYNGNNGAVYDTLPLAGITPASDGTYDYYVIELPSNGIQNGSPDGMALSDNGTLIEFLSYEGTFDGVGGAADGVTSVDIGVSETSSTEIGLSLQRNDDGTWAEPTAETPNAENFGGSSGAPPRINELHYDNAGTDTGEFIEVRTDAGADVSGLVVELYNGNNGAVYDTLPLAGLTPTSDGSYDYYVLELPPNGIQNGSPDGVALSDNGALIEFLSYEGTFDGVGGAADGVTSVDIGVAETSSTEIGQSLQRAEDGTWVAPSDETPGAENLTGGGGGGGTGEEILISALQGSGDVTPYLDQLVTVEAIVTYVTVDGFFLQEEDTDADADTSTSEGVFVFVGESVAKPAVGDAVQVTGTATEFFGETQIGSVTGVTTLSSGNAMPTAASIALGAGPIDFEAFEGMYVSVTSATESPLTVIENFNLDRFGEITISAGNQVQPTQIYDAQTQATEVSALAEANANNRLIIDDGLSAQNPDEFAFIPASTGDDGDGILDSGDTFTEDGPTLRLGAELTAPVEGVLFYGFGDYRMLVDGQLQIDEATNSGARTDAPEDVGGDIQVGSMNVLNYFTTLAGQGGSGPNGLDPRGATSPEDLARQTAKIVDAILGSGAEVLALQELENNGFGPDSAISTLVDALNAEAALRGLPAIYGFVDPTGDDPDGFIGDDAITTGIIYDTTQVTLAASDYHVFTESTAQTTYDLAVPLNAVVPSSDQLDDLQRNRPVVAATFVHNDTGEEFTVASNHFKSKGDSNLQDVVEAAQQYLDNGGTGITQAQIDALMADPNYDQGDGQGFWNGVRTEAAIELQDWLRTTYNGGELNYLILGDLNAYAMEDPVQAISDSIFAQDLIDMFINQDEAYSYVFDGQRGTLDQALASNVMAGHVVGVTEWHINADEPDLLNYSSQFNDPAFYNDDPYASSDHDPLLIGLDFDGPILV